MMTIKLLALVALVVVFALAKKSEQQVKEDKYPNYENPVTSSDEDEIQNLPGLNDPVNFRQFSGYLRADDEKKPTKFFHYWFVESQSEPSKDPIVLWLNGGPGCSSLGGLFTELGPFSMNDDGKTLKLNKFSWNTVANVIFLESPARVGFSYSNSMFNFHTDDSTARENHLALKSFFQKFPQYKNNPLYLTGESYAGVYLPTLGQLVDADPELNLKGIAIGNGYMDVGKLTDSLVFFAYSHGLVGKSTWDRISQHCCNGQPPARDTCAFRGRGTSFSCGFAVGEVSAVLSSSGLNPYNLYGKCLSARRNTGTLLTAFNRTLSSKEIVDRAMWNLVLNPRELHGELGDSDKADRPFHVFNAQEWYESSELGLEPPCFDDHTLIEYLNDKQVRKAIHVPEKVGAWDTCSLLVYVMKYAKLEGGLAPQMRHLIESKRNLTLLVYNGDVDTVCNFLGDEWFVDDLGRDVVRDYSIWRVDNQVAGFVKHYKGITYATVRGSGHMVPGDKPREALAMFKAFLNATNGHIMDL